MPVVRVSKSGDGEEEGLGGVKSGSADLTRITTNLRLAEHIGKFIAGEVASQYTNENLADALKGKNMIMISGSWG